MEYGDVFWDGCTDGESDLLEFVQYEAAKIVMGAMKGTSRHSLMQEIGWEDMKTRRSIHKLIFYFKIINNLTPNYLKGLLPPQVFERTHYFLEIVSGFHSISSSFKKMFSLHRLCCGMILTHLYVLLIQLFYLKKPCFIFLMFHSKICYLTFLSIDILLSFTLVYV